MHLYNKEKIQEIKEVLDERLVWEYLRIAAELKLALLSSGIAVPSNLDEIFKEYMDFEYQCLKDESYQKNMENL